MMSPRAMRRRVGADPGRDFRGTRNRLHARPETVIARRRTGRHRLVHSLQGGIERVHAQPDERNGLPSLLMIQGMWHDATCWSNWQGWFADKGWESVADLRPGLSSF